VPLDDPAMSREHAEFAIDARGRVTVMDLDSRNGTFIDGRRLDPRQPVALHGQESVVLGDTRCFTSSEPRDRSPAVTSDLYVSESEVMREPLSTADKIAERRVPVLITGETGTGKDEMARYIHRRSLVRDGPYIAVNCARLDPSLAMSELFGAEAGAYTDAREARAGLIEQAADGTLFLDEVGELPLLVQAKLLRVLENHEVRRLAGKEERKVEFRLIAATNRDLDALVAEGRFREDLLYRLRIIEISLPPLRAHPEDIGPLAKVLLRRVTLAEGLDGDLTLSDEAVAALRAYAWPGNIRQLHAVMTRSALLLQGRVIGPEDLHFDGTAPPVTAPGSAERLERPAHRGPAGEELASRIEKVEREALLEALTKTGGVVAGAARRLGKTRKAVYKLAKEHGIDIEDFRDRPRGDDEAKS